MCCRCLYYIYIYIDVYMFYIVNEYVIAILHARILDVYVVCSILCTKSLLPDSKHPPQARGNPQSKCSTVY